MSAIASTESAREALRREHGVRLVTPAEEGCAAESLPAGVYGFTASPLLASPLFATRRFRNFEVHRLASGPAVIGFVTAADAARLRAPSDTPITIQIYPDSQGEATILVAVPYDRVVQHRQYAVRNADAIAVQLAPDRREDPTLHREAV
jgi:hypothetical protein